MTRNGDTMLEATLRRLRIRSAAYRCEWPAPAGAAGAITVGPEFFIDAIDFPASEVVVIHSLPVGGVHRCAGGPVGDLLTVTRTQ